MITVVSGTNRAGSNTRKVGEKYVESLLATHAEFQHLTLDQLPRDIAFTYLADQQSPEMKELIRIYFEKADKFIFIIPEYQGTFPGIFKLLLDAVNPRLLARKKVLLVGVANGRGGNLRGMDQLTNALHYLGMNIFPNHLAISRFRELLDADGQFNDENTLRSIRVQIDEFLQF